MRALKFYSDLTLIRSDAKIENIDTSIFQEILENDAFLVALFLQKTAEQGEESFFHSFGILKQFMNINTTLKTFISELSRFTNFEFRGKAKSIIESLNIKPLS